MGGGQLLQAKLKQGRKTVSNRMGRAITNSWGWVWGDHWMWLSGVNLREAGVGWREFSTVNNSPPCEG